MSVPNAHLDGSLILLTMHVKKSTMTAKLMKQTGNAQHATLAMILLTELASSHLLTWLVQPIRAAKDGKMVLALNALQDGC